MVFDPGLTFHYSRDIMLNKTGEVSLSRGKEIRNPQTLFIFRRLATDLQYSDRRLIPSHYLEYQDIIPRYQPLQRQQHGSSDIRLERTEKTLVLHPAEIPLQ